jgi:DNA mismatch endonuclease (patch repair protein)
MIGAQVARRKNAKRQNPRMPLSRSETMARVRSKNTTTEMQVRRALHKAGLRYRLHAKELPGTPDIIFRRQRVAVFVHGCFWHQHPGCPRARRPSTHREYWEPKFQRNMQRDAKAEADLKAKGWTVFVIWECEETDASIMPLLALFDEVKTVDKKISGCNTNLARKRNHCVHRDV